MKSELTTIEYKELKDCETTIEISQGAFVACGNAIAKIRDSKLYRAEYDTFEEYCKQKWGWKKSRAYQIIEAAGLVNSLPESDRSNIKNEHQARLIINEKRGDSNQKRPQSVDKIINLDKTGFPIPESVIEQWNRAEEVGKELMSLVSQVKCAIKKSREDSDVIFREVTTSADTHCTNLYEYMKCIVPFSVCTSCQGHNPTRCTLCKGRGFISKHIYDHAIPEEIKIIRQKSILKVSK